MKSVTLATVFVVLGLLVGYLVGNDKASNLAEEVISKEVALLNQVSLIPTCKDLLSSKSGVNHVVKNDIHLLWRFDVHTRKIKKAVISPDLTTAYEEYIVNCN